MNAPDYFEQLQPTRLIFGPGTISQAGEVFLGLGARKALILSAPSAVRNGFTERLESSLEQAGVEPTAMFERIPPDGGVDIVAEAAGIGMEAGCDSVAAIGGGSVLDTAKAVDLVLTYGGDVAEDWQGAYIVPGPLRPLLVLPTTAGSGTEMTIMAMIRHREQKMKISLLSPFLAPHAAILDPETTVPLPPRLTALTGVDALTHALEALISTRAQPFSDAVALQAISMIMEWLPIAVADGDDINARSQMLIAASLAGLAASNAYVGVIHSLAHALGGMAGAHHADACSILLPVGLEYNIVDGAERLALAANATGIESGSKTIPGLADAVLERVEEFLAGLPLPRQLRDLNVDKELIPDIAELAMGDGTLLTNPRPVEDPRDLADLLEKAW